jgi:pimeloyl-ACP methyl ester carboxylesterase
VNLRRWTEEEVTFPFGSNQLHGILTLPAREGHHPAIVLIYGSADAGTGVRSGVSSSYLIEHARTMAGEGFAALTYDPPGVGRSTGEPGFDSLDGRMEEAVAALHYLQTQPDIRSDRVGLWGVSQGGWVIAMAAAAYPQDVAFIISVSGSGVSVAAQQVHSVEAQSRAAGMSEEDIAKATLFARLLIYWQVPRPLHQTANEAAAQALGDGPWADFARLVYEPGQITPAEGLKQGIDILRSVQDEPWARFLYLKELYIPQLESVPPEQVEALKAMAGQSLLNDPQEYFTKVRCPVLAVFGEDDLLQPSAKSASLYEQYLTAAGNDDFEIVVIPDVGHHIYLVNADYSVALTRWLEELYSN